MQPSAIAGLVNAVLPELAGSTIERVTEGGSTEVYRVRKGNTTCYVRLLPEVDASFAPEAKVHRQLSTWGVQVPDVLTFVHEYAPFARSVLITSEIPGQAIGHGEHRSEYRSILRNAGRDLARLGSIQVAGFGWIDRSTADVDRLRAEHPSFAAWMGPEIEQACSVLATAQLLSNAELARIRVLARELIELVGDAPAILAHGDFDGTHIYHQAGVYSGIIDFGEIRGTNLLYDLGHFQMENSESLPDLLDGYREVRPLPSEALREITLTGLVIAVGRLANAITKGRKPHPPYLAAVTRNLAWLTTRERSNDGRSNLSAGPE